ncbi:hypothetical protein INS49_009585 [Diaporthe citri]|uniref:uncharacterized protein n=1 Tax=Diaporthe citri TaxID=83186 RepID=UPI001C7F3431|nr:uncharacterized protein INS49_009585 [Diaporthe citri]KAG6361360.1 hypothetical protein INS49_009585 [Diaporthe citri]
MTGALGTQHHELHFCTTMLRFVVWENVAYGRKAVVLERVKGIAGKNRAPMPPVCRGLVKIDTTIPSTYAQSERGGLPTGKPE